MERRSTALYGANPRIIPKEEDKIVATEIQLDDLTATAEVVGAEEQPWHPHGTAYKYAVTVTDGACRPERHAQTAQAQTAWSTVLDHRILASRWSLGVPC